MYFERVNTVILQLENSREFVRTRLDRTLTEMTRISSAKLRIREATQLIEAHRLQQEGSKLTFDQPPIWRIEPAPDSLAGRIPHEFRTRLDSVTEFTRANQPDVIATFILLWAIVVPQIFLPMLPVTLQVTRAADT